MTSHTPADPIPAGQLESFAQNLRHGKTSALQATQAYLARIKQFDPKLQAFQHLEEQAALDTAKAMDALLAAGTDLGPLMGVPIAIKDVFNIQGYPEPTVGSKAPLQHLFDAGQGPFISALRSAGAVILGVTKSVEVCLGITGVSEPLGTPWNPWDMDHQRVPGGSSSGSAVACAAGLCALAIGTDTGGSVRVPAAFNGVFGLKTTHGRWPLSGAFPLAPNLDTIGLLSKSAKDAVLAFDAIESQLFGSQNAPHHRQASVASLRLGRPSNYFYENLDASVAQAVSAAESDLANAGAMFTDFEMVEAPEREGYFPITLPSYLLGTMGREGYEAARSQMDPIISQRVDSVNDVLATDFVAAMLKRDKSIESAKAYFDSLDVVVSPATAIPAPLLTDFDDPEQAMAHALGTTRNSQPSNYLGQCAVSLPLPRQSGELPIGYQLMGAPGSDVKLLDIAVAIEEQLGLASAPTLA